MMQSGAEDGQFVEAEGIVHSVTQVSANAFQPSSTRLQLAMPDGMVNVTVPNDSGTKYTNLIDAKVLVHAASAPILNSNGQMIGVQLY